MPIKSKCVPNAAILTQRDFRETVEKRPQKRLFSTPRFPERQPEIN